VLVELTILASKKNDRYLHVLHVSPEICRKRWISGSVKLAEVCEVAIELYYQEVGLVLGNIYADFS